MAAPLERKHPEPIDQMNPWADDVLGRQDDADFLMKLLQDNEMGLVLNVDSVWGSGKTFFLERWRQSISSDYATVWFNAWAAT